MRVNGTDIDLDEDICLYDYLISNKYNINKIAVEYNGNIIPKSNYKNIILDNKGTLEIVSFVGGG
ncbi:thiamine biosynthesis protein ThiS [Vallitalea longa]|uniref:Thiamine biosynthesis protein ThiS n=1 Tax=Vallitalea longa TaxID=2936439 RepID=A0A9W5Y7K2_9FIRM|nr:sulfur carrier protein ThiS [Vallitalea longa]GKX27614.1 thiamine biosynthesis protein ThiS [Vallitalea longa]